MTSVKKGCEEFKTCYVEMVKIMASKGGGSLNC